MTDKPSIATTAQTYTDDVSPDSLMNDFRGRPFVSILVFTVIAHVVLVGVFSVRYLRNEVLGEDTSSMTEEERLDIAVREATTSLRKIAERHGVSPQDLSERFAKGSSQQTSTTSSQPATTSSQPATSDVLEAPPVSEDPGPEEPKSAIERELQKKADGPDLPALEEEDDLF